MKKKVALFLAMAVLGAGSLAAQMSIGAGGYVGGDFGGGYQASISAMGVSADTVMKLPYFGGGGFVFLDAQYVELFTGFFTGGGTMSMTAKATGVPGIQNESLESDLTYSNLSLGILGKYPISISEAISFFPLLGIDYLISTAVKEKSSGTEYSDYKDFSSFWFKLGGGLDFAVADNIFVRLEALYGLRLANKIEKDLKKNMDPLIDAAKAAGASGESKTRLGHGLTVKLALGYKI
jgi:opacity protein-like surface antigen